MFIECEFCGFNITQDASFCINCGTQNPTQPLLINEKTHNSLSIIVMITILGAVLAVFLKIVFGDSKFVDISFKEIFPVAGIGAMIGFAISFFIEAIIRHKVLKKTKIKNEIHRAGQTFRSKEDEISGRKFEILQDKKAIEDLLDEEQTISEREKLNLQMKTEIIDAESFICDMELLEINLLREKNNIIPFQQFINGLNLLEIEDGLKITNEILSYEDDDEIIDDFEETGSLNKELADLRNWIDEICKNVEDSVFKHSNDLDEAARVLQPALERRKESLLRGVTPTNEMIIPFSVFSNSSLKNPDFKIDSILTNFSGSFNKLAVEFEKLDNV